MLYPTKTNRSKTYFQWSASGVPEVSGTTDSCYLKDLQSFLGTRKICRCVVRSDSKFSPSKIPLFGCTFLTGINLVEVQHLVREPYSHNELHVPGTCEPWRIVIFFVQFAARMFMTSYHIMHSRRLDPPEEPNADPTKESPRGWLVCIRICIMWKKSKIDRTALQT